MTDDLRATALDSKAWPFEEARKLLARYPEGKPTPILFECGYGPSGLPHLGTFQEVLRTTMVRNAFATLSDAPTRLIEFSDDMDGLRKVPGNVPNQAMLTEYLGKPLSRIPDPFEKHESFAAHNNAMLRDFLDRFGFDYEFVAASSRYESGAFDEALKGVLCNFDAIMGVMLPTLRAERAASYSPILPISEKSGIVLQVPVEVVDADAGTIAFVEDGERVVQSALGGNAKLQWKVDWAMRWVALGVDYEMYGKDLIDSGIQSGKIARILGGAKPEGFVYEMFLDEAGEKISKSKGNGLTIEQWLSYGSPESLSFYAYREPKKAKSLHMGIIPRAIDDYWQFRGTYPAQTLKEKLGNPVHHIHNGVLPEETLPVSFGLLLNLVSQPGVGDRATVWRFLQRYGPDLSPEANPSLDALVDLAISYARDFVTPSLEPRAPTPEEAEALRDLDLALERLGRDASGEDLQNEVYEIGKARFGKERLRDWFAVLYETLLGSNQGPRMGSFIALYGVENTRKLIGDALSR